MRIYKNRMALKRHKKKESEEDRNRKGKVEVLQECFTQHTGIPVI
jgi:hypothetical protein